MPLIISHLYPLVRDTLQQRSKKTLLKHGKAVRKTLLQARPADPTIPSKQQSRKHSFSFSPTAGDSQDRGYTETCTPARRAGLLWDGFKLSYPIAWRRPGHLDRPLRGPGRPLKPTHGLGVLRFKETGIPVAFSTSQLPFQSSRQNSVADMNYPLLWKASQ